MINTVDIKRARDEVFTLNSCATCGDPKLVILIVGSCRCVAYLNYLKRFNESHGRPFRIHYIEPNDYCIGFNGEGLQDLPKAETNPAVLDAVRSATIFLHEHYQNYGMFNTNRAMGKNIYQFGMTAPIDVSIPNFHDRFILFREQLQFRGNEMLGHVNETPFENMKQYGFDAVARFVEACYASSLPEFGDEFLNEWTKKRYFWTGNHVSRHFNLSIFRHINDRFLHLPLDDAFWAGAATEDLFAKPCTPVTQEDVDAYGLTWDAQDMEPLVPLKL